MAATGWYGPGLTHVFNEGATNLTFKIMLLGTANATYAFDQDEEFIDNGGNDSSDASFCEADADDYTPGFAGAGRKTVTITFSWDAANGQMKGVFSANVVWTGLGGTNNDTIDKGVLIVEDTDDTASHLIACFNVTNRTSNNTDYTLIVDPTDGNLWLTPNET